MLVGRLIGRLGLAAIVGGMIGGVSDRTSTAVAITAVVLGAVAFGVGLVLDRDDDR
jgi:ABC-type tungstate transport system substrate-binding protein